jgi:hypothetical protein
MDFCTNQASHVKKADDSANLTAEGINSRRTHHNLGPPRCLVVSVLGYRSGGPGSIPGTTRQKVVDLERGPLSLVSTTEELLDRKVAAPV